MQNNTQLLHFDFSPTLKVEAVRVSSVNVQRDVLIQ